MSDSNVTADESLAPVTDADCCSTAVSEDDEASAGKTSELSSGHNATANRKALKSLSFDRGMRIVTGRLRGGLPWGITFPGSEVPDQGAGNPYVMPGMAAQINSEP